MIYMSSVIFFREYFACFGYKLDDLFTIYNLCAFSSTLKCFDVSVSVYMIRGGLELHVCLDFMGVMVAFHYLVIIIRG